MATVVWERQLTNVEANAKVIRWAVYSVLLGTVLLSISKSHENSAVLILGNLFLCVGGITAGAKSGLFSWIYSPTLSNNVSTVACSIELKESGFIYKASNSSTFIFYNKIIEAGMTDVNVILKMEKNFQGSEPGMSISIPFAAIQKSSMAPNEFLDKFIGQLPECNKITSEKNLLSKPKMKLGKKILYVLGALCGCYLLWINFFVKGG